MIPEAGRPGDENLKMSTISTKGNNMKLSSTRGTAIWLALACLSFTVAARASAQEAVGMEENAAIEAKRTVPRASVTGRSTRPLTGPRTQSSWSSEMP